MRARNIAIVVGIGLGIGATAGFATDSARAATTVPGDFNGDGRSDLVIGVRGEDIGAAADVGAVHVLAGTAGGVRTRGGQLWTEDRDEVPDTVEAADAFGTASAAGDFDGDGYGDLAIGAPGESLVGNAAAGQVTVLYGSPFGLDARDADLLSQGVGEITSTPEPGDLFGEALVAGDFDADGRDDLVIGAPGETIAGETAAGTVHVVYGTGEGLDGSRSRRFDQEHIGAASEAGDGFGAALATGDLDADGRDDVAIGAGGEDIGALADAGQVVVLSGSPTGIVPADGLRFHQDSVGVVGVAETGDAFGARLAIGDFDGDDTADLAVAAPTEGIGSATEGGALHLFEGSVDGVTITGNRVLYQGYLGVPGRSEAGDQFAGAIAAGDFDGDGDDDLAVGTPGEDFEGIDSAGTVTIFKGSAAGIAAAGAKVWSQDSENVQEVPEAADAFGSGLGVGDYDGDRKDDLAIASAESVGAAALAGSVHVLYGSASGLGSADSQYFTQDTTSIPDGAEAGDLFGVQP